jgi:hypothetical protein
MVLEVEEEAASMMLLRMTLLASIQNSQESLTMKWQG